MWWLSSFATILGECSTIYSPPGRRIKEEEEEEKMSKQKQTEKTIAIEQARRRRLRESRFYKRSSTDVEYDCGFTQCLRFAHEHEPTVLYLSVITSNVDEP